jgi:hypothetical protein
MPVQKIQAKPFQWVQLCNYTFSSKIISQHTDAYLTLVWKFYKYRYSFYFLDNCGHTVPVYFKEWCGSIFFTGFFTTGISYGTVLISVSTMVNYGVSRISFILSFGKQCTYFIEYIDLNLSAVKLGHSFPTPAIRLSLIWHILN